MRITIALGCDHAGLQLKNTLTPLIKEWGYHVLDFGTHSEDPVDYPDFAKLVVNCMSYGTAELGLLICGTGIGMSIAANRFPGARAALCHTSLEATLARQHNDANILCLGARLIGPAMAEDCLKSFLTSNFLGGRHLQRVSKLNTNQTHTLPLVNPSQ